MKEVWTITKEDAAEMCEFLRRELDDYMKHGDVEPDELDALQNVHAALMWAGQQMRVDNA
jgi:hypothetical protein